MLTNRRRNALTFCSSLAIATALAAAPQAASAQSFQGNSTVVSGSATVTTGANTTTVDVGPAEPRGDFVAPEQPLTLMDMLTKASHPLLDEQARSEGVEEVAS